MSEITLLDSFERLGLRAKPLKTPYEHIQFFIVDLASIMVVPGADTTIFFSVDPRTPLDSDAAGQVEEIIQARGYRDRLKFIEYSNVTEDGLRILHDIPGLAAFSRSDLAQLKKTAPLKSFLAGMVVKRASLSALNPYTFQGPVVGSRFFGRVEELKTLRLQASKSFVLSGVRRSGKTSLMMELIRQLREDSASELIVSVNFETCQKFSDVPYMVLRSLGEEVKSSPSLSDWSDNLLRLANSRQWQQPNHMVRLSTALWGLISSQEEAHRIRFFFDEYDKVVNLEQAHDRVFTKIWRDLVIRGREVHRGRSPIYVQFVFAGSRRLYEEIISTSSPFFNIGAERLLLQNFDLDTLNALVTRPMRELGVEVQDAARVAQVLIEQTGGHPSTTQHLLSLVVADAEVEKARMIDFNDVIRAASTQEFLGMLRATLNMNISILGRFILAQIAIAKREKVNSDFIHGVGRKHSVAFEESVLTNEMQDLANSGYLRPLDFAAGQSSYKLAVPVLKHLFSSDDVPNLIQGMLFKKVCTLLPKP